MDKTAIQNLAIVLVGGKTIVSASDKSKAALLVKSLWDISYRGMLELPYDWEFAVTRQEITGNLTTTPAIGHYGYRYKLPELCLRVIAQIDRYDDNVESEHRIENFMDSNNKTFPVIVTNESKCYIKYICDLGQDYEIRRWPGWFARIVALDLAQQMCEPLKQDKQKVNQLDAKMNLPVIGWMARAIQANGLYGMDTTSNNDDTSKGNNDVVNAAAEMVSTRSRIIER